MKKCHHPKLGILFIILVLFMNNKAFSQSIIQDERKKIVGTWISEESTWTFIFGSDMKCSEYYKGKLDARYFYKITAANSVCGKQASVDVKDSTVTFLQLDNIKTKEQTCFFINGVSDEILSITGSGFSQPNLFNRKILNKKRSPVKKE